MFSFARAAWKSALRDRHRIADYQGQLKPRGNISSMWVDGWCLCRLSNLGTPEQVADYLLQAQIARPGSGKVAQLIACSNYIDANGISYYRIEYQVRKDGVGAWQRHNLAVLSARNDVLYTFNAQCRESKWSELGTMYAKAADSFQLRVS